MAEAGTKLEDLKSLYGPYNNKGDKGTGEVRDTLANEGTAGVAAGGSKYQGIEKVGQKPTGPDPFGNRPPEKLAGH
tara:strand:+ start:319 stop:546 length:228 start_codon:yes stop_codon:yes gene_type:complete